MTNEPIGEAIKAWREKHGVTQLQLANRIGITTKTLSVTENGHTKPSPLVEKAIRAVISKPFKP